MTNNMPFREFVILMQEAAGDRAKKIARIKNDIQRLEREIHNKEQSQDRYAITKQYSDDHSKLYNLHAQLKRYQPPKGPSAAGKRKAAIKNQEIRQKEKQAALSAATKKAEEKKVSDQHHEIAKKEAKQHADKIHPIPEREKDEDVFKYIDRTRDHMHKHSRIEMDKYHEVRQRLKNEKDV